MSTRETIEIMQLKGFDQVPVTSSESSPKLVGLATLGNILAKVASKRVALDEPVSISMFTWDSKHRFMEITQNTPLDSLQRFFEKHHSACVTERAADGSSLLVKSVVTKVDLLSYLMKKSKPVGAV